MPELLLDFDGTLTDAPKEAEPAIEKWADLFSYRTYVPLPFLKDEIARIKAEISQDREAGWENNGKIVAPATADPFVLNTVAYQRFIKKYADEWNLPKGQASREKMVEEMFRASYPFSATVFRDGAKDFLNELVVRFHVTIVTNSDTKRVREKLARLVEYPVPLVGDAKKYVITEDEDVPESMRLDGLQRPVLLGRGHYKAILDTYDPRRTAVVGDIFELDLALPEHMGFRVAQIATPTTPMYEAAHYNGRNGFFGRTFDDVLGFLARR